MSHQFSNGCRNAKSLAFESLHKVLTFIYAYLIILPNNIITRVAKFLFYQIDNFRTQSNKRKKKSEFGQSYTKLTEHLFIFPNVYIYKIV